MFAVRAVFMTAIMALGVIFPISANAYIPSPRLKPIAPNTSAYLSNDDARLFRSGLRAADRKQWSTVKRIHGQITDQTAKDLLMWIQANKNPAISMQDLNYVVQRLNDWPRMVQIQAQAEGRLFDRPMPPQRTVEWFHAKEPVSGEGRAALARAHFALRNPAEGDKWLRSAWRSSKLTRDRQKQLFSEYKDRLTPNDHATRADHLIWQGRGHFSKVQGLLPLMDRGQAALMEARMRVHTNGRGMDSAIRRVPAELQRDPGLLYERARWRRRKKTKEYALPTYLDITVPPVSDDGKRRVWREKKIMAYWAIEQRRFSDAYALAKDHGMTRGSGFAEAEFLAGWLALTKMRQPQLAVTHFDRLKNGVTYPVSLSRASYWLGRSHEAMNSVTAQSHYRDAAKFRNTFYGFLAGQKTTSGTLLVSLPFENDARHLMTQFEGDPRVRAMHLLGEARKERMFTQFAFHLDDDFETLEYLTLLSGLAKRYDYMKPSLRAAKQASRFQSMLTDSGYPMPQAIMGLPDKFDKAFVLAIARQESEFNHRAVSHARAYGLMQMINATARSTARRHRVPYNRSRMTQDIHYSATLGALHLHDLLRDFDGSYIMAAVAYNAGPHRAKQWVRAYGDPRKGEIDPIDWLESIPFSETRNYVQRVMENMQVYRARMNGNTAENRVYRDITIGAF